MVPTSFMVRELASFFSIDGILSCIKARSVIKNSIGALSLSILGTLHMHMKRVNNYGLHNTNLSKIGEGFLMLVCYAWTLRITSPYPCP